MPISTTQRKQLTNTVIQYLYTTKYSNLQAINVNAGQHLKEFLFPLKYQDALLHMADVVNVHSDHMAGLLGHQLSKVILPHKTTIRISKDALNVKYPALIPFNPNVLHCDPFVDVLGISDLEIDKSLYSQSLKVLTYLSSCQQFVDDCEWWYEFFESHKDVSMATFRRKYHCFHKALEMCKSFDQEAAVNAINPTFLKYARDNFADTYLQQVG